MINSPPTMRPATPPCRRNCSVLGGGSWPGVAPGSRVLDLGCGAGRDMAWLEAQGATIIGGDLSAGMLAQARPRVHGPLAPGWICAVWRSPPAASAGSGAWPHCSICRRPLRPALCARCGACCGPAGCCSWAFKRGAAKDGKAGRPAPQAHVQRLFARYSPDEACGSAGARRVRHCGAGEQSGRYAPLAPIPCGARAGTGIRTVQLLLRPDAAL